jgi:hypothetical protein
MGCLLSAVFALVSIGLTQIYEKTNRKGHKGHEVKRVSESSCVSSVLFNIFLVLSIQDANAK